MSGEKRETEERKSVLTMAGKIKLPHPNKEVSKYNFHEQILLKLPVEVTIQVFGEL